MKMGITLSNVAVAFGFEQPKRKRKHYNKQNRYDASNKSPQIIRGHPVIHSFGFRKPASNTNKPTQRRNQRVAPARSGHGKPRRTKGRAGPRRL